MAEKETKILFLHYSDVKMTGGERMTLRLLLGMRDSEFTPVFLTQRPGPLAIAARANGITTIVCPLPKLLDRYDGEILRYSALLKCRATAQLLAYNWTLARLLKSERITAIWCSNVRALLTVGLTARVLQIPVVWNIWLARQFNRHGPMIYRVCYALATHIVTEYREQPHEVFSKLNQNRWRDKISTVYTGVDAAFFEIPGTECPEIETRDDRVCEVLSCCRITPRKDIECFLEALMILKSKGRRIHATIVGSPFTEVDRIYHQELLKKISRDGTESEITFIEWTDDVRPLLAKADLYVSSSTAEGLPGAIREAQAAGVPVVATDAGGTREAVMGGVTGLIVPCRDPHGLADAIERLAKNPQLAREFGKAARARAAQLFTTEGFIRSYSDVFRDVVRVKKQAAA